MVQEKDPSTKAEYGWLVSYTLTVDSSGKKSWVADNGGAPLLALDRVYESASVGDGAVTKFGCCYVMVYGTEIPP